jgi:hypothetical protein
VLYCAAFLAGVRSQFEFLIADHSALARSLTERAFSHLRRSLIADRDLQARWLSAFDEGEPSLERLGAVHLLAHGIWAFKAHAPDSRTDLVLGTPLGSTDEAERTSEAMVLTEWKRLTDVRDAETAANEAEKQARIYSSGVLAGFELRDVRYVVLVSREGLHSVPADRTYGDVTYRVVSIPIEPSTPSEAARKRA